jgi:hypothetical protein
MHETTFQSRSYVRDESDILTCGRKIFPNIMKPLQNSRRLKSDMRQISILRTQYRYASHNIVAVNDGPHIRQWPLILILKY